MRYTGLLYFLLLITWLTWFDQSNLKYRLNEYSSTNLIYLRNEIASPGLDFRMKLVSQLGDKTGLGGLIFLAVHLMDRNDSFVAATAFCMSVTLVGVLKLFYQEGRPFFLNPAIYPNSCDDLEYGYPSGHSCATACTYITIYNCFMIRHLKVRSQLCFFSGLFGVLLLLLAVAFSRAYVGVHSYDQLLNGFVVGLLLALFLTCDPVYEYLIHLRSVIMPYPLISDRPYQVMLPSANHTLLNYLTLTFFAL